MRTLIQRARYAYPLHDRMRLAVVHLAGIYEAVVFFLSLGFLCSDVRAEILFSNWYDDPPE